MANRILGYIIAIIGVIAVAAGVLPQIKEILTFLPATVTATTLLIGGAIIAVIGILLILKSGNRGKQAREIPIYHGKNVVGYRRH